MAAMFLQPGGVATCTSENRRTHEIAPQLSGLSMIDHGDFIVEILRCRIQDVPNDPLTDWTIRSPPPPLLPGQLP